MRLADPLPDEDVTLPGVADEDDAVLGEELAVVRDVRELAVGHRVLGVQVRQAAGEDRRRGDAGLAQSVLAGALDEAEGDLGARRDEGEVATGERVVDRAVVERLEECERARHRRVPAG